MLHINDYPQLQSIAWNRRPEDLIKEQEAFALYERNWLYVDKALITPDEQALIERLTLQFGDGILNV
jgi:hypothetical protein